MTGVIYIFLSIWKHCHRFFVKVWRFGKRATHVSSLISAKSEATAALQWKQRDRLCPKGTNPPAGTCKAHLSLIILMNAAALSDL